VSLILWMLVGKSRMSGPDSSLRDVKVTPAVVDALRKWRDAMLITPVWRLNSASSETSSESDGNELCTDALGWRVVIARLGIEAVWSVADPEGNAAACVPAGNE
jgi:hypothetical protein